MAQRTGALVFDERTDRYDIRFDLNAQPDGIHRQPLPKNAFAEIPVPFYLIISDCHASRHNPLLHTFTDNNEILAGTSSHEIGFCHPFIPA